MTIAPQQQGSRFELFTDWSGYQKILEVVGERPIRVTYDRGRLELMTPGWVREARKTILAAILEALMTSLDIDFLGGGCMTFQREDLDKGFEPDECYWIEHWEALRGRQEWKAHRDPPPDLALEVEITSSLINRLGLYHAIGVPEVWRLTRDSGIVFLHREPDRYEQVPVSPHFSWLRPAVLDAWLARDVSQPKIVSGFLAQVPAASSQPFDLHRTQYRMRAMLALDIAGTGRQEPPVGRQ